MAQKQVGNFVIEIDETVTKKEVFRVGDAVKVFEKTYSDKYNVYPGIIVGFVESDELAAIEVLYITDEYSTAKIKRGVIYANNKDLYLAHTDISEFGRQVIDALESLDNAIVKAKFELQAAIAYRAAFERNFGKAFGINQPEPQAQQ